MRKILPNIILLFIFFSSCDTNNIYNQYVNIPDDIWNMQNIVEFNPDIRDTSSIFNIYVHIRNTGEYPMSNLFLFVKTTSPQGFFVKDTFECVLTDYKGKWLGKGFGSVWNNKILYKENVIFPSTGNYLFQFEQAMRINELPGIIDVGLSIEKVAH